MEEKIYLFFIDSDENTHIMGYIKGTQEEADKWCEEYNAKLESWESKACYYEPENLKENAQKRNK